MCSDRGDTNPPTSTEVDTPTRPGRGQPAQLWHRLATRGLDCDIAPLDRDPEMIERDLADRFISAEAARTVYGAVLVEGDPTTVDRAATEELRQELRAARLRGTQ